MQDEEDQHGADSHTRVERGREYIVVLGPPGEVTPADDILEQEADDGPGNVVDGAGGGDGTSSVEDDGEVDVAEPAVGPFQANDVGDERAEDTNEEEEGEGWKIQMRKLV